MLTKIANLERLGDFRLRVRFNDGSVGVHDFATMIAKPGSMYVPLRGARLFRARLHEHGALTWPNGFDIALEWLRREMSGAGELMTATAV